MKKNLLIITLLIVSATWLKAQTTAPDFTALDCNGTSHNLYTDLNAGKVIVLNWVMPCGACVAPSLNAYNIVQGYTNGKVLYYLIDDAGNTSCNSLSGWATNSGIGPNRTTFSSASIVETNYGGTGMPHVVVVGSNHTIYFNGLNAAAGNSTGITNAINTALSATGIVDPVSVENNLSVSFADNKSVKANFNLKAPSKVTLTIINELGQTVNTLDLGYQIAGSHTSDLDLKNATEGHYFIRLVSGSDVQTVKFTLSR